jgi:transposase-like protein
MKNSNWKDAIADWQRSGLSQSEFCRQGNLNKNTFGYWLRRARKEGVLEGTFVKVGGASSATAIELRLSNGAELRIPSGFSPSSLRALLEVLQ